MTWILGITSRLAGVDRAALLPGRLGGVLIECPVPGPDQREDIMALFTSRKLASSYTR
jgi:ATP-dependent 26S proteasome regulatory subunit